MPRFATLLILCLVSTIACNRDSQTNSESGIDHANSIKPAAPVDVAQVPDLDFEPLCQQHIDMYLAVMKEAVEKRKQLPEADKKVLADEAYYYAHIKSGWHAKPSLELQALLKRSHELHHLDDDVAKQKGNYELYSRVRAAIEGMVGPTKCGDSDCGQGVPEDDPVLLKKQLEDDKKRKATIKQDLVLLGPFEAEITLLVKQMR